ncbi:MAG: response regulator [Candidatus Marinimicrobia bacterium]|nr:response regulator [Candidatus Neomarinimicrobiota bacterium]
MKKPIILIVEDSQTNIHVLGRILKDQDYELAFATNGKEGYQMAINVKPDLILLDIMMPVMDGFETCKKLKALDLVKDIPVIFLTARGNADDIVAGFELGAVDYITKPFNSHELLARVKTHLTLQQTIKQLKQSLDEIRTLKGLLPICAKCKKVRDDEGYWQSVEKYISSRTDTKFTHSICPDCLKELYPEYYDKKYKENTDNK